MDKNSILFIRKKNRIKIHEFYQKFLLHQMKEAKEEIGAIRFEIIAGEDPW